MQVSTSNSGRARGAANRTPLVARSGTRKAEASRASAWLSASSSRRKCRCSSTYTLLAAEQPDEPIQQPADAVAPGVERRPADERDEAGGVAVQIFQRQRAFAFGRAQLHARDETAEIPIALLVSQRTGRRKLKSEV